MEEKLRTPIISALNFSNDQSKRCAIQIRSRDESSLDVKKKRWWIVADEYRNTDVGCSLCCLLQLLRAHYSESGGGEKMQNECAGEYSF